MSVPRCGFSKRALCNIRESSTVRRASLWRTKRSDSMKSIKYVNEVVEARPRDTWIHGATSSNIAGMV
jgi:hypothetical protein